MKWNWQLSDWPDFKYKSEFLKKTEEEFLYSSGVFFGACKHLDSKDSNLLKIELISNEALKTSEIEGEYLDRESLRSSIRKHFGLKGDERNIRPSEQGISDLMVDLYGTFQNKLDDNMLHRWHKMLMSGRNDIVYVGEYRKGKEPMQIVSGPMHKPMVHFEAPPSNILQKEMFSFRKWFNSSENNLSILTRAGIAHIYFESVHPFEDGNGRIGRAIAEKALAQGLGKPTLIVLSTIINKEKKEYYSELARVNRTNEITSWLEYFVNTVLKALKFSHHYTEFLIDKNRLFNKLEGRLNPRQERCLLRMFNEGVEGFKGGLSAENYMKITKASIATATRDLKDLVEKKALNKTGKLRYTRYHLNVKSLN